MNVNIFKKENQLSFTWKVGNGKSGLTENIIDWCNKSNILHLALKLDCYIPEGTAQDG